MRADGDFCSREHRNQSRLRRGLDRLEEANKVANLMRRRENPRQIPTAMPTASAAAVRRGALEPARFPVRAAENRFTAFAPVLSRARLAGGGQRFSTPLSDLTRSAAATANRRMTPAWLPFTARASATPVLGPVKARKQAAGVALAGLASIPRQVPPDGATVRECGAQLRLSRSAALRNCQFAVEAPGAASLKSGRRLRSLAEGTVRAGAREPRPLRNIDFEKRAPLASSRDRRQTLPMGLPRPRRTELTLPEALDRAAAPRSGAIARQEGVVRLPRQLAPRGVAGARGREAAPLLLAASRTISAATRLARVVWIPETPEGGPSLHCDISFGGSFAGAPRPHAPLPIAAARDAAGERREAEVRFSAGDSPFEAAPMALQGGFEPAGGEIAPPPAESFEEHFDAGLDRWAGDTAEWRLDAAGARPAGLALFRPTLGLSDYEFEFFTRIEARAASFVFRASNLSNYQKVTIAMVESGRYELRRCAVIGGVAETAATSPLPGVLRPGAAFTVKTRATQNDFTIWLDGELAARWTDGRLPTGGIGFVASRDDRARVYWVRLSPVDGPNSQAANRKVRSIQ